MTPARWIAARWNSVVFAEGSPYNLAAARIVIATQALWILLSRDLAGISGLPGEFWMGVPRSTQWRFLLFPGHPVFESAVQALTIAALIMGVLGWRTRWTCLAAALGLYHLAPLETIIWRDSAMERGLEIAILALVLLAVAPCADVWSVETKRDQAPPPRWSYHWPLLAIQLLLAEVYLFAAFAKLQRGGLAWMAPDNLRRWLLVLTQHEGVAVFTGAGRFIADQPLLSGVIAVLAVVAELAFPLVLVTPRLRRVLVPMVAAGHLGVYFSMNIAFLNVPQLLVFVNWDWLRWRWRGGQPSPGAAAAPLVPAALGRPAAR